jgi:hypothetical protein
MSNELFDGALQISLLTLSEMFPALPTRITVGDFKITTSGTGIPTNPWIQATLTKASDLGNYLKEKEALSVKVNRGVFTVAQFPLSKLEQPILPEGIGDLRLIADAHVEDLQGYPAKLSLFEDSRRYLYIGWTPGH